MPKLHELLAAEKTPTSAFNQVMEETLKKFGNPSHFYEGHSKSLAMIEDTAANKAIEEQAREEKPVPASVYDTMAYLLDLFAKAEDLQYQKNATNRKASADVMFRGQVLLTNMPVDELLGLEARLVKVRALFAAMPTLDATKHWLRADQIGAYIYETRYPEETTKTDKQIIPVTLKEATREHPAQVQAVSKDMVVGKFTMIKRSGAATALQKAEAIKCVDELLVEIKQARMRANETEAVTDRVAKVIVSILMEPLKHHGEGDR